MTYSKQKRKFLFFYLKIYQEIYLYIENNVKNK